MATEERRRLVGCSAVIESYFVIIRDGHSETERVTSHHTRSCHVEWPHGQSSQRLPFQRWSRNGYQKVSCTQGRLLCPLVQTHPKASTNEPKKCCTSVLQIFSLVWKIYVALESCSQSLLTIPIAASPRPPTVVSLLCFTWLSGGIRIAFYDIELSPKIELWAQTSGWNC